MAGAVWAPAHLRGPADHRETTIPNASDTRRALSPKFPPPAPGKASNGAPDAGRPPGGR